MNQRNPKIVAVFGGSRVAPDSADYAEAYTVGKLLAQRGFVVMNGAGARWECCRANSVGSRRTRTSMKW